MTPIVKAHFDPATSTVTYVVFDPATKAAAVIDPVYDFEPKGARLSHGSANAILYLIDIYWACIQTTQQWQACISFQLV